VAKGLISVAIGLVVFIMVSELVDALVVGTDTGSVIIQNILALGLLLGLWRVIAIEKRAEVGETYVALQYGNPEPSRFPFGNRACVETMGFASPEEEMVR